MSLVRELESLKLNDEYWNHEKLTPRAQGTPQTSRPNIHQVIRAAGRSVPRYLFRAWSCTSGGDSRLNTLDNITPKAFLKPRKGPASIFDIDPGRLKGLIHGHLHREPVLTPFSSWPHSLPFVLAIAADCQNDRHDAFVSVVDAHRLTPANYVFHCGAIELQTMGIDGFGEEFLIFGLLGGDAYEAAPYKDLGRFTANMLKYWDSYEPTAWKGNVKEATGFGKKFGPEFELPAAISFLAARKETAQNAKLHERLLKGLAIPAAWLTDAIFPMLPPKREGYTHEAAAAALTMRAVTKQLQSNGHLSNSTTEAEGDAEDLQAYGEMSDTPAEHACTNKTQKQKHLKLTSRMSSKVHKLYIDMVGYDGHNDALKA